jgi:hypothetical protein
VTQAGATLVVLEVEPWVLPAGAGAEMGGEPTVATDAGATGEAGRWDYVATPPDISGEHCWMKQP